MLVTFGVGALLAGCLSPTLPLPPPSRPDITRVEDGVYELRGTLPMPGTVFVQNERTTLLFGVRVETFYELLVEARPGDFMKLWYEASDTSQFYGDRSQSIEFEIPDTPMRAPVSDGGTSEGGTP
jgi:hypothetical protein